MNYFALLSHLHKTGNIQTYSHLLIPRIKYVCIFEFVYKIIQYKNNNIHTLYHIKYL